MLELLDQDAEQPRAERAVDDPVIAGHGEGHALADDDLAVLHDRFLDQAADGEDAGLGRVSLSRREFLLLRELTRNAGRTMSKERLLSSVWRLSHDPGSNVVDVYVRRLRAKLGVDFITTVRGEGYRFDALG